MNRLWLTQVYLYRWYIPDLTRLANGIETNPVQLFALLIQVQICLTVLATANSFTKLCLSTKENHVKLRDTNYTSMKTT